MEVKSRDGKLYKIEPGADLSGADLSRVNLDGVKLDKANLGGTNLSNSNLKYISLTSALLINADLSGADLSGADLNRVKYDDKTVFPDGFDLSDISSSISSSQNYERAINSVDQSSYHESSDNRPVQNKQLTGIGLLRVLAWIWLIFCPLGGVVFWLEFENMFGFQLFLAASLSGVVTFAIFLVLCTIAENLIEINKAVASSSQPNS